MWACRRCTLENPQNLDVCGACDSPRCQDDFGAFGSGQQYTSQSGWSCPQCTYFNSPEDRGCEMCGYVGSNLSYHFQRPSDSNSTDFGAKNEIRIVLIGRTGSGKSASGNTILGKQDEFQSLTSGSSVTSKCKRGENLRHGKKTIVVDTPGLFDTGMTNEKVTKEIVKCIGVTSPGPHAIVFVVGIGRFTREEQETVQHFINHFGEGMLRYMIVLFTRKDELSKQNQSIYQYVNTVPEELKTILDQCANRYIAFNNDASGYEREAQVDEFFNMVDRMVSNNGGVCYTSEIYQEAEATLQRRMREQRETLESQKRQEEEMIMRKVTQQYEIKLEQERYEKSRLEETLNAKKEKERMIKEENRALDDEIRELKKQKECLMDRQNNEERRKLEERVELLQQQIQANETKTTEREREALQKKLEEANNRYQRDMREKKEEIKRQKEKIKEDYEKKMDAEKLRKQERDKVENDDEGALYDIATGFKKLCTGIGKGVKNGFKLLKDLF